MSATSLRDQVPDVAVRRCPILAVPLSFGRRDAVRVPGVTTAGSETACTVGEPDLMPLTFTVRLRLAVYGVGVYAFAVAPVIGAPSSSHWYWKLVGAGLQEPVAAVTGAPTTGEPTIAGWVELTGAGALKWMMPSGQPPPDLVTLRQSNDPLQLDSETQISLLDTTFSM